MSTTPLNIPAGTPGLSAEAVRILNDRLQRIVAQPAGAAPPTLIQTPHLMRLAHFNPTDYPVGTLLYETDRTVTYVTRHKHWMYESGIMQAVRASRPADLTPHDVGFLFLATDEQILYSWDGKKWIEVLDGAPPDDGNDMGPIGLDEIEELARLLSAVPEPRPFHTEIEELRRAVSAVPEPRPFHTEIEELRRAVSALEAVSVPVVSVFGRNGNVVLLASDIPDLSGTYAKLSGATFIGELICQETGGQIASGSPQFAVVRLAGTYADAVADLNTGDVGQKSVLRFMQGATVAATLTCYGNAYGGSETSYLDIMNLAAANIRLGTNGVQRWMVTSAGMLLAFADAAYDIGASGANRPRNLYLSGAANIGGAAAIGGAATVGTPGTGAGSVVTVDAAQTLTNKTIAYASNICTGFPTGGPTAQLTPTIAVNTVYQNTTGKTVWVNVVGTVSGGVSAVAYCDNAASPSTVVSLFQCPTGPVYCTLSFLVLPNYYWKISVGFALYTGTAVEIG